jgi:pimeloyl-ACP methyl ester carboxylesterase
VQFSDVIVKTGVRIHYAYKGDPAGTPVIMLHGYTDSWFSFSNVLPLLDNKYRVYILDQRGHGDSSCPVGGYAMDQFAGDVLAFMDAMNLKQATIVGHSMGSFVAQHVAALAPERVTKLVLVASATTVRNHTVLELQREIDKLADHVPESFARDFQLSTAYQPLPPEFLQGVVKQSLKTPARVWREVMAEMVSPDANVELKKIKTPTLILWGDKETIFPRSEQELLVSALKNSTLKVYADTGHAPHWDVPSGSRETCRISSTNVLFHAKTQRRKEVTSRLCNLLCAIA